VELPLRLGSSSRSFLESKAQLGKAYRRTNALGARAVGVAVKRRAATVRAAWSRWRQACVREGDVEFAINATVGPAIKLPRHTLNRRVNQILERAEAVVNQILKGELSQPLQAPSTSGLRSNGRTVGTEDKVYANSYVDFRDAEVVGFDYDYTLVSYKPAVLDLIYNLSRTILIQESGYPEALQHALHGYDPDFAIRGIAVDLETAWICSLTHRYRVSVAFHGRERVSDRAVRDMYKSATGVGILSPEERCRRMHPLNDLFSTVEACLLADVVQWFKDQDLPFDPRNVVNDVIGAVGQAHISGKLHNNVIQDLDSFIEPDGRRHLRTLLQQLQRSGKKVMLVSNSPYWYVNAGMSYVVGEDWRKVFNAIVVCAGKPDFYTQNRSFRELSTPTKWKPITCIDPNKVYTGGSIGELMRLTGWGYSEEDDTVDGSKFIYLGDSLFSDLVEARRLYGWTTGAIIREVRRETHIHSTREWRVAWQILQALIHCIQLCQEEMGTDLAEGEKNLQQPYSEFDKLVLDELEDLAAEQRRKQDGCMNVNFGSIFRTSKDLGRTAVPSLFARSLQRHVDFYTSRVENLRLYSTDHRFYPDMRIGILHESTHMEDSILELVRGGGAAIQGPIES